jgi:hypothetical protein
MKKLVVAGAASALFLSACAAPPESIAPAYVSPVPYQNYSCKQLGEESQRLDSAYATAAAEQTKARNDDTLGVILIGLPVSSMSGENVAPQVAQIKGQQQTVQQMMITKNCAPTIYGAPPPPAPDISPKH